MKPVIKLLIADDQSLFAECLEIALKADSEIIEIIGIANNGLEVLDYLKNNEPDIILMDIEMPEMNGLETLKHIYISYPDIKVLILTTFHDQEYVQQAIDYGAKGYLLKDVNTKKLVHSIQMILEDMSIFSESIVGPSGIISKPDFLIRTEGEIPGWYLSLTRREKELLHYLKIGLSNKEISSNINLSEQTVKNYVSVLYNKLAVHSRKDLRKKLNG